MGAVFGRIAEEQPAFAVLRAAQAGACELRKYEPMIVATTRYDVNSGMTNSGGEFGRLARFIGVFSTPANEGGAESKPTAISMTAPVLLSSPAPRANEDTAHHMNRERVMMFTMPASRFKSLDEVPKPTDARVTIEELPSQTMAVKTFHWSLTKAMVTQNLEELLAELETDPDVMPVLKNDEPKWLVAGYNAPFTLPWLKTNDVLVEVQQREVNSLESVSLSSAPST